MTRFIRNRSRERWALLAATRRKNRRLAVFVHGFRGEYLDTWGRLPDMLAKHADGSDPFRDWDYVFIGYDTRDIETYLDIALLLVTEVRAAVAGEPRYGHAYERFALFGHSLGTLGIRQLLCASSIRQAELLKRIQNVTLFGSPINGSPLAFLGEILGYRIASALTPSNPQLRMLREWSRSASQTESWPRVRLIVGQDDRVVGDKNAYFVDWPNDEWPPCVTTYDHTHLTKPDTWSASHVADYISGGLK